MGWNIVQISSKHYSVTSSKGAWKADLIQNYYCDAQNQWLRKCCRPGSLFCSTNFCTNVLANLFSCCTVPLSIKLTKAPLISFRTRPATPSVRKNLSDNRSNITP